MARDEIGEAINELQGVRRSAPYNGQAEDLERARSHLRFAIRAQSQPMAFIVFFLVVLPLSGGLWALQEGGDAYLPGPVSFVVHGTFFALAAAAGHIAQKWRQAKLEAEHEPWLTMPLAPNE